MTQLARQAYLLIEDAVDAVAQKYRAQRIVRGAILFVASAAVATLLASLLAHAVGAGWGARLVLIVYLLALAAAFAQWVARPLLIRPRPVAVARMIEGRIDGLHNGLTNALLLADRPDLQSSPWLGPIFDEILVNTRGARLDTAVRLADLRRLAGYGGLAVALALFVGVLLKNQVAHGWQQMFSPAAFVPRQGDMIIDRVEPGDVTLVAGRPLEIAAAAHGPITPVARLLFERDLPPAELTPVVQTDNTLRYSYRVEHVDRSVRYRLEVGKTQSPWYTVNVVQQVKPLALSVTITPPAYTRLSAGVVQVDLDPAKRQPLRVPQGSKLELNLGIDVPVNGAMLQLGSAPPLSMRATADGMHFSGSATATADVLATVLLTEGAGQIIAQLPEPPLALSVIPDAPPVIELKWPAQDTATAPARSLKIQANLKDDYGLSNVRILSSHNAAEPLTAATDTRLAEEPATHALGAELSIPADVAVHGRSVRVQIEATDNRRLGDSPSDGGPQTTRSNIIEIKFRDPGQIAADQKENADRLRQILHQLLQRQQELLSDAAAYKPGDNPRQQKIHAAQTALRDAMQQTAQTFPFAADDRIIQKTLLVLAFGPAKEAIDLSAAISTELIPAQQTKLNEDLMAHQRRIITALQSLLALLNPSEQPQAEKTGKQGDLPNEKQALAKLNEELKEYIAQQQRILDQTANLAKKPVDNWDADDRRLLDELTMAQEKLDNFMQQKVSDYSKLAEQDMANAVLLRELLEVYSEVTMARDALRKDAIEIAVSLEESGLELAKELSSNLEKWLMDEPDRIKWTMEDPLTRTDTPMAELPTELEDMIGELMEQEEDLFDEMEDTNANWTDSIDKGAGWDAMDGPIANMSAKGVTGNALPNNNEMGGRSGEGRSGKSQGEMVEDTASGKGGRRTPTRLDPTAFQQGQINDTSTDPVGGATGGGKLSGQGGEGLEGPVPPARQEQLQRLAQKQAQIRNTAERIQMQYRLGRYDNFQLLKAIAMMRRVEADLGANRYQNALRRRDVLLDDLGASQLLSGGAVHVQRDTTPSLARRMEDRINATTAGQLPPAWSQVLGTYYRKLASE